MASTSSMSRGRNLFAMPSRFALAVRLSMANGV
jgi:hypothetical protein